MKETRNLKEGETPDNGAAHARAFVVIVTAGLLIAGMGSLALVILALYKAPEGYEDEHRFYAVRKVTVVHDVLRSVIKDTLRAVSFCGLATKNDFGAIL